MEAFDGLLREALVATAIVALPAVAIAALAGTAVAIVQAATQVQEQTLSFLPKLIAVGAVIALFGAAAMRVLARLFEDALATLPALLSAR
jgi:flagellar biosynthetic protein FliQ